MDADKEPLYDSDPTATNSISWLLDRACQGSKRHRRYYVSLVERATSSQAGILLRMRVHSPSYFAFAKNGVANQIALLKEFPDVFWLAVACSVSPNGYIREQAVRNLGAMHDDRVLPILMMRSADWVAPVSALAQLSLLERLSQVKDSALFWGVEAYLALGRYDTPGTHRIRRAFSTEVARREGLVLKMRRTRHDPVQRFLLSSGITAASETLETRVADALASRTQTALQAVRSLILQNPEARRSMMDGLVANPLAQAALIGVEAAQEEDRPDLLLIGMFHGNWRVRASARFYLKGRGIQDFRERYEARLPEPAAVLGLAEITFDDAPLAAILPLLDHEDARIRAAAVSALGGREYRPATPKLIERVGDPNTKIARLAVRALLRQGAVLTLKQAFEAMDVRLSARNRRLFVSMLVPKWDRLTILLRLARGQKPPAKLRTSILRWLEDCGHPLVTPRRGGLVLSDHSTLPRREQIERALAELDLSEDYLEPGLAHRLRVGLGKWLEFLSA